MPGTCEKCNPDQSCNICNPDFVIDDHGRCMFCYDILGKYSYSKKECVPLCNVGNETGQCKTCIETEPNLCGSCNENQTLKDGKCVLAYEIEIIGEAVVGSKLFAEINPQEASSYISYQWNADNEPIIGETTRILIIKKEYYGKTISLSIKTNQDSIYQSDINEIDSNLKVGGKECLPNVLQCNSCDSDQITCLECKIGQDIDKC